MTRRHETMKLGMVVNGAGTHIAAWRHPRAVPDAAMNRGHFLEIARVAERGKLDFIFLADALSVRETSPDALARTEQYVAQFEPITLLSLLSAVTKSIGLVATASTSYYEPYHLARIFASLDLLSGGRAGWNIVTSASDAEARNFGRASHYGHEARYDRAAEFTHAVLGLWDSWEDHAFVHDPASGIVMDPAKMHKLGHKGPHFSVEGPLNVPRSPQGHPVLIQAGASATGRDFAARFAEVVFTGPMTLPEGQAVYADIKAQAEALGRRAVDVKVLPGFCPIVGRTEGEAKQRYDELQSLVDPIVAREHLSVTLGGVDLSPYPMNGPLPDLPLPKAGSLSTFQTTVDLARRENLTIAELAMRITSARQKMFVVGSVGQIVDRMEEWFTQGAADGFNLMPAILPASLTDFIELVIPELQRRGLFRVEYEGSTLRENLGLSRPASRI